MDQFRNAAGGVIVLDLIKVIQDNVTYLSEVDGAIGDGDHGINMNKGFTICGERLAGKEVTLTDGLKTLGTILLTEIGGSMGPLYGSLFRGMAKGCKDMEMIDTEVFERMLTTALVKVSDIGNAKVGDKTMMDTLVPAVAMFQEERKAGKSFSISLEAMTASAKEGMESTVDLVAKVGRAARLGERSRGVVDAGATSCFLILDSMYRSIEKLL